MPTHEVELPDFAPFQLEWLNDPHRFRAIEGATGTGKTYVFEPYLFQQAHQPVARGDEYWWVAPTLQQSRAIFEDITRRLQAGGLGEYYRTQKLPMEIETPEGGIMRFLTGENPDNLFGIRNVRLIIVDEFTRCRPSLWAALLSIANKTGARIVLIGNYQGATSPWHLWVERMQGEENFRYWRTPATEAVEAGIMPREMFEAARRTLPETVFNALYLCRDSHDISAIVKYHKVSDIWTNDHVPEGEPALTCDIAMQGSDRFVVMRWSGWRIKEIDVMRKMDPDQIVDVIKAKSTQYQIPRSRIVYDGDGVGTYLRSYLDGAVEFRGSTSQIQMDGRKMNYRNLRSQCHFLCADRINDGGVYCETPMEREALEREIHACLRTSGQDAAGRWGIFPKDHPSEGAIARLGHSPDLFDPVAMRVLLDLDNQVMTADTFAESHTAFKKRRMSFKEPRAKNLFGGR